MRHFGITWSRDAHGYAPTEYENVLAAEDFKSHARRDDRIRVAADVHEWARASTAAFVDGPSNEPDDEFVALLIASSDGVCALEAVENGAIAATAAMNYAAPIGHTLALRSVLKGLHDRVGHLLGVAKRSACCRERTVRSRRPHIPSPSRV